MEWNGIPWVFFGTYSMRSKQCQQERSAQKFEHFGLWGEEAYDYLTELAKGSSPDSEGRKNVADFLTRWRRQL